ncbi:MAG: toll/interleukin-1 receptor domain-containing protein, partial [Alistipes sp.]|nr:toll/interleukin-1 receptor domain-containing protein [Alistipes sp.]
MNKEIFISYTSKDRALASTILKALEQNGFACWMAPRDIAPGEDYSSAIPSAIIASTVVVTLCSSAAYESPNVKAELRLAFDYRKKIIPFKIEASSIPNSWQYFLAFSQWIDAADDPELHFDELLESICRYVQKGDTLEPQPEPKYQPATTYNVGDYYDDGVKQGVVFEVDASGRHGKIVSLVQDQLAWCTSSEYKKFRGMRTNTYTKNGELNQHKVKQIYGWRNKYPAFVWCADLGEDW